MCALFFHDPLNWFQDGNETPKEKQEYIRNILMQRTQNGYAWYDWINFSDYFSMLMLRTSELVCSGRILAPDSSVKAAAIILDNAEQSQTIYEMQHQFAGTGGLKNRMASFVKMDTLARTAVEKFFINVFPYLPAGNKHYSIPVVERNDFIAPEDYQTLGSFLSTILNQALVSFKTNGHTYPSRLDTVEEWHTIIDTICEGITPTVNPFLNEYARENIIAFYFALND